jgi:hypothetical protein
MQERERDVVDRLQLHPQTGSQEREAFGGLAGDERQGTATQTIDRLDAGPREQMEWNGVERGDRPNLF